MNIGDYNFYYDLQTKIDTDVEGRTHVFFLKNKGMAIGSRLFRP